MVALCVPELLLKRPDLAAADFSLVKLGGAVYDQVRAHVCLEDLARIARTLIVALDEQTFPRAKEVADAAGFTGAGGAA